MYSNISFKSAFENFEIEEVVYVHLLVGKPWVFLTHSLKNFVGQVYLLTFVTSLTINFELKKGKVTHKGNKVDDGSFIGGPGLED